MEYRFSPSTLGFYPTSIDYGEQLPNDCVLVGEELFQVIINPLPNQRRSADVNGYPILIDSGIVPTPNTTRITRAQGKKQLHAEGLYTFVKTAIDTDPEQPEMVRIGFYDEEYWVIDSPFVQSFKENLNLTDAKLQQMFNDASKL